MNIEYKDEIQDLQDTLAEYKPMLKINPMELDEECRQQPEKFELIGLLATRAKALSRTAKDILDFTESDIKSKVRKDPANYGLTGKVTNDAVNEIVEIQDDLQEAKRGYIELLKISDDFSIVVNRMEQRKAMLRDLVSLFVHKYYSNQSLSGEERSLANSFEEDLAEERSRDIEGRVENDGKVE